MQIPNKKCFVGVMAAKRRIHPNLFEFWKDKGGAQAFRANRCRMPFPRSFGLELVIELEFSNFEGFY